MNILIEEGKINEGNLQKERLSIEELTSKLREKNAFRLADVEYAILETDGEISVMLKPDKQPVTPSILKLQTQNSGLPVILIDDGNIIKENIKESGLTTAYLMSKLAEQGIYDVSRVMLAQYDGAGNLYIDLYEDDGISQSNGEYDQMLVAKLEKIHSDFTSYSMETQNDEAKKLYKECEIKTSSIITQFKGYMDKKVN
jgi:hypothetical protein